MVLTSSLTSSRHVNIHLLRILVLDVHIYVAHRSLSNMDCRLLADYIVLLVHPGSHLFPAATCVQDILYHTPDFSAEMEVKAWTDWKAYYINGYICKKRRKEKGKKEQYCQDTARIILPCLACSRKPAPQTIYL